MNPSKFGPYEVISEIGRGGMATVYRARDPRVGREVAIKVLPREMLHDPQFRVRFEREARTVANLEHPAVVPIYDLGEQDGQPYFVMRYMDGGSLSDRLKKGALPLQDILDILTALAPALDEAHAKGIIHRDLKPANILFDHNGKPYLSDFGIAKIRGAQRTLTGDVIVGTPTYISPEQAQGRDIDGRTDIYALGVMLYQMLTGDVPYHADTPMAVLMKHISEPTPCLLDARPDLPPALDMALQKAMAKAPEDRYPTAQALVDDLKAIFSDNAAEWPTLARPGSPSTAPDLTATLPAAAGKKAFPIWMLVVGAALLVGLLAGGGWYLSRLLAQPGPAAPPSPTASPMSAPAASPTERPAIPSPTSHPVQPPPPTAVPSATPTARPAAPVLGGADKIAFLARNEIWLINVDGSGLTQLTFDGAEKTGLQWLPDQNALLYRSGLCLKTVQTDTLREDLLTCLPNTQFIDGAQVSPDGRQLAISLDRELYILPFEPDLLSTLRGRADIARAADCRVAADIATKDIRWSADGKMLAVAFAGVAGGRREDMIRVLAIRACAGGGAADTVRRDEFPAQRFTMSGYVDNPLIPDFSWSGESVFLLHSARRNGGFGNLYEYQMETHKAKKLDPLGGSCCYRDARWSPDGLYIAFAYQDINLGANSSTLLYYLPFGLIDTGAQFEPLPLPPDFFARTDSPQPVFHPAP